MIGKYHKFNVFIFYLKLFDNFKTIFKNINNV